MVALLAVIFLWAAPPSFASLTVTDPDGNPTGDHFTDFIMVPGDTQSTVFSLRQNTEDTILTGMRLEPLSEPTELHDDIVITVEGLGSAHTMPLIEPLQRNSTLWLGELPPQQDAQIAVTVHFPFSAGNETQRTEAPFQVIFTAQRLPSQELPGETHAPPEIEPYEAAAPGDQHPESQLSVTGSASFLLVLLALGLLFTGLAAFHTMRKYAH